MRHFMGAGMDQIVIVPSDLYQPRGAHCLGQLQLSRREITVCAFEVDGTASAFTYVKAHLNTFEGDVVPGLSQPEMRAFEKLDYFVLDELPRIVTVQMRLVGRCAGRIPRWVAVPVGVRSEHTHRVLGIISRPGRDPDHEARQ